MNSSPLRVKNLTKRLQRHGGECRQSGKSSKQHSFFARLHLIKTFYVETKRRSGRRNAVWLILRRPFENSRPARHKGMILQDFLEVPLHRYAVKLYQVLSSHLIFQVPPKEYDPTSRGRNTASPEQVFPGSRPSQGSLLRNRQYTNLDLIKADTPFTPKKISKMLHQLEFKHQVELQYKEGIDKMARLYQADGDKKSKADAEAKRFESDKKIQLLESALKRYKNLHILDDVEDDENGAFRYFYFHPHLLNALQMPAAMTANVKINCGQSLCRARCM